MIVFHVADDDIKTNWQMYKYAFCKCICQQRKTQAVKRQYSWPTCDILVQEKISIFPLSLWEYGCLAGTQQQVCVKSGSEPVRFIFKRSDEQMMQRKQPLLINDFGIRQTDKNLLAHTTLVLLCT